MHNKNQKYRRINLLLGNACNKSCSYCLQNKYDLTKKADVRVFKDNFYRYIKKYKIDSKSVHYWGGEPLLYKTTLFELINFFSEVLPSCEMHRITTNATLIDKEYVDFVNSKPTILTVVSLHEFDIPQQCLELIGKIKRINLMGVVSKLRPTPMSYYEDWEKICHFAKKEIHIGLTPIHAVNNASNNTWLTINDVETFFRNLIFGFILNNDSFYKKSILETFSHQTNSEKLYINAPKCVNSEILSIDMFGNQYNCHHNNSLENRTFNIFDNQRFIPINQPNTGIFYFSQKCQNCECLNSCHGGCFLSNTHDVECFWNKTQSKIVNLYEIYSNNKR